MNFSNHDLPKTMLAAVLHGPGDTDQFQLENIPVPDFGPDEVLIQVKACGVSNRDVVERNGTYRRDVTFPRVIGLEISGIVKACGNDVRELKVGDHVCTKAFSSCGHCRLCRNGRETTCRSRRPVSGGYAEFVALPQDACVRLPQDMPFENSCTLGPAAGVALNAVRDVAQVNVGESILITGASGGVGIPAVQFAKAAGAHVITLTRSASKIKSLTEIGADEVIVSASGADFSPQVLELTGTLGVDVVIDTVGSRVFDAAFSSLAVHGRYAFVGQLFGEKSSINLARIFFKRASLLGVGSVSRTQLEDAIRLTSEGVTEPRVAETLPLTRVAEAHRLVESGEHFGRIVLKP